MEVVHTFYSALHNLDTLTMDSCGSRKALKNYSNMAATLFVTGKMRQAYENTPSFLTPEQWIVSDNPLAFLFVKIMSAKITQTSSMEVGAPARTLVKQTGEVHVLPPADFFRSSEARLRSPQVFRQISARPLA